MKKVLYIAMLLIAVVATSCSGGAGSSDGYDQKKVDELTAKLDKSQEKASEADVKALAEQIKFALDEADKAEDLVKWNGENSDKAVTIGKGVVLDMLAEELNFSEETIKVCKEVSERANAYMEKLGEAQAKAAGIDLTEDM